MKANLLKSEVLKAVVSRSGKPILSCKKALQIAEKLKVTPKRVGALCDKENIKIRQCQLGCF